MTLNDLERRNSPYFAFLWNSTDIYVFERFGELHFLPTFKAWSVRLCIAIVKSDTSRLFGYEFGSFSGRFRHSS